MKKILIAGMLLPVVMASCVSKPKDQSQEQASKLMSRSIRIACQYRDSIKLSHDSASVLRLMEAYDEALTKLNYDFPPDIYLNSSEAQNESLAKINARIVQLRDSILFRLAHPVQRVDTDSVAVPTAQTTMSNKPVS